MRILTNLFKKRSSLILKSSTEVIIGGEVYIITGYMSEMGFHGYRKLTVELEPKRDAIEKRQNLVW